jgi:electron transfer flavoprotein alpha subunit
MTLLILAEHDQITLSPATLTTVGAALAIGGEIHLLLAGKDCASVIAACTAIQGVSKVIHADGFGYSVPLAESLAVLVQSVVEKGDYSHILAPANSFGKDVLPRAAALCDSQQISDVVAIVAPDTFTRPIYAGNALETVQSQQKWHFLTIRPTAFEPAPAYGGAAEIQFIDPIAPVGMAKNIRFVEMQHTPSARPDLTTAKIVVSGGRGLGSAEQYQAVLEPLADALGAALGASRAAVDAGYAPNDAQVGQTGKVVAPALYIAVGISGAIQHLAGMKDSKTIVAINKDENAPIFDVADYGIVGDLFSIVPELTATLKG